MAIAEQDGGWRVAVSALGLITIAAYGIAYYSYGVLIDPIRADTGWSSPALGAVFSGVLVIGGAGGLAGGRLVDRLGTRPAFLIAAAVMLAMVVTTIRTLRRREAALAELETSRGRR